MRTMSRTLCLLLVSCAIGLSLSEISLRLFYPRYRDLAEAQFESDALRIWARTRNWRDSIVHPDTGLPHSLLHNNFGLRQHRDFREADLDAAVNIGVFGDSFTENIFMAAPYSFTEPLDYLLNLQRDRLNVLNFGVNGYGPGQSLLHYEHFPFAGDFDHVFYVYQRSDLSDIYVHGLFTLDEEGRLAQVKGRTGSWWAPLVRRLHVTYLVLDVIRRTSRPYDIYARSPALRALRRDRPEDDMSLDGQRILEIFRQLIRRWKNLVEDNGGAFSIVLLPDIPSPSYVVDLIRAENIDVIDLYACFNDVDPAHSRTLWAESPYRFRNDGHWNEAGNSLATVCLYRAIEERMGLPVLSEDGLREAVSRYYAAFGGEDFLTFEQPSRGRPSEPPAASAEIRKKYMELDLEIMEP